VTQFENKVEEFGKGIAIRAYLLSWIFISQSRILPTLL
jgi:hypothetical protein